LSTEKPLEIGVVGLGKMGLLHSCILNTFPNVKIAAVCDTSSILRKISRKIFKDVQAINDVFKLSSLNLDAVFVTTPIPSHYPILKTIHSQKIANHVFVEKTLASDFKKADELCNLFQNPAYVNMVGYMKRYSVTFMKAKELIEQGVLGDLVSFNSYAYSSDFAETPQGSTASIARGGVLEDLGSHVVNLALWFFGDLKVDSASTKAVLASGSEDEVQFTVNGRDELTGKVDVSWCRKEFRMPEFGFTVIGNKGALSVNDDKVSLNQKKSKPVNWYRPDLADSVGFLIGGPEYFREDAVFLKAISENGSGCPDFSEASKTDYLIDEIKSKAKTNE
jgi:predicted dehydrogenase